MWRGLGCPLCPAVIPSTLFNISQTRFSLQGGQTEDPKTCWLLLAFFLLILHGRTSTTGLGEPVTVAKDLGMVSSYLYSEVFLHRVACNSTGCPGTCHVAKDGLQLLIFLPSSFQGSGTAGICHHTLDKWCWRWNSSSSMHCSKLATFPPFQIIL